MHFLKAIGDYVHKQIGKYEDILGILPLELAILWISLIRVVNIGPIPTSNGFSS